MEDKSECIRGMVDKNGRSVREGDIVEFFQWCYASHGGNGTYQPLFGIVQWNEEYFTYEPLIFATDDYHGNCFAYVCKPDDNYGHRPASYFKVIGNVRTTPDILSTMPMTQKVNG